MKRRWKNRVAPRVRLCAEVMIGAVAVLVAVRTVTLGAPGHLVALAPVPFAAAWRLWRRDEAAGWPAVWAVTVFVSSVSAERLVSDGAANLAAHATMAGLVTWVAFVELARTLGEVRVWLVAGLAFCVMTAAATAVEIAEAAVSWHAVGADRFHDTITDLAADWGGGMIAVCAVTAARRRG